MATMTQAQTATFTKLRTGDWGIRGPAGIKAGELVQVRKKDGSVQEVKVHKVLWRGDGIVLASIYEGGRTVSQPTSGRATVSRRSAYSGSSYGRRSYGSGRGSAAPVAGYSSYCTANEYCTCFDCI